MFGIPLLFAYLVSAFVNCGVLLMWAYRRFSGPAWSQEERIIEDAGLVVFGDWMRIQTLSKRLTLVTLTQGQWPVLRIKPIPGLADDVYSSVLSALDLGLYLTQLTVEAQTNLVHTELMVFIQRHPHLTHLSFAPNSIQLSSLTAMPMPSKSESKVSLLIAPACYIPHLLPSAPNVQRIQIPFLPATHPRLVRSAAFDLVAYRQALAALAALPGTHPLSLALSFRLTAAALPWLALRDAEARGADSVPETRLPRVQDLALSAAGPARFRPADIRALVRWLALFPALQRVSFARGAVAQIPAAERSVLAEVICAACSGIASTQDVMFNIFDD